MWMEFGSIWLILKLYFHIYSNIKPEEYGKFEFWKDPYSLDALIAICRFLKTQLNLQFPSSQPETLAACALARFPGESEESCHLMPQWFAEEGEGGGKEKDWLSPIERERDWGLSREKEVRWKMERISWLFSHQNHYMQGRVSVENISWVRFC